MCEERCGEVVGKDGYFDLLDLRVEKNGGFDCRLVYIEFRFALTFVSPPGITEEHLYFSCL